MRPWSHVPPDGPFTAVPGAPTGAGSPSGPARRGARFSSSMSDSPVRLVPETPPASPEVPHLRRDPHALQRSFLAHVQYTRGQGPDLPLRGTGSWRSRWPCATGSRSAGWRRSGRYHALDREARLLPLGRVPAGSRAGQQPHQHRPAGGRARGAARARASTSTRCSRWSPTPASATAASAASPPASSTRWPRSATRLRLRHPLRVRHLRRRTSSTATRSSAPTSG